jgi:hypothetical protein
VVTKKLQLGFDKESAWNKVKDRLSVFMDMNCWINMRDEKCAVAVAVRDRLKDLVSSGQVVCPLSWGLIEELFTQSPDLRQRTAKLMEELSLNVTYIMRREAFDWEIARSIRRVAGEKVDDSLNGLLAPVAAFSGSPFAVEFPDDYPIEKVDQELVRAIAKQELGVIGLARLVDTLNVPPNEDHEPPAYSEAAKRARKRAKGSKSKLLEMEANEVFRIYVLRSLMIYPPAAVAEWMANVVNPSKRDTLTLESFASLPALGNYVEIMATVDSEPDTHYENNDFFDYEIMAVPLAYSSVFVSKDKGIRHLLRQRTQILKRTRCEYCDGLEALEQWLNDKGLS